MLEYQSFPNFQFFPNFQLNSFLSSKILSSRLWPEIREFIQCMNIGIINKDTKTVVLTTSSQTSEFSTVMIFFLFDHVILIRAQEGKANIQLNNNLDP